MGEEALGRRHGRRRARLHEVERVLQETDQRYRSLFEYHPSAVFSLDLEGRFTAANSAAERLSGYTEAQLRERFFADLLAADDLTVVAEAFLRNLDREAQQFQTAILRRDGSTADLDVTGLPIVVDDEVVGVYGIATDITERLRLERELRSARRSAEQASEAKSQFLAMVSHEIRTPLTSMIATAELLGEADLDPQPARFVATLERSGQRLLRLVGDVLDFSRLEAGATTLERVDLDLRGVVQESVALVRPAAEGRGLALTSYVDPRLPRRLLGDAERLTQVLGNLLDNAVKFTHEGSVQVHVEVLEQGEGAARVRLEVRDSGIGLSEEQQERLFESFSQADSSISRRYGGTGLGLAICQQLVTLMDGTVAVASRPGHGSTFTVDLPVAAPFSPPTSAPTG